MRQWRRFAAVALCCLAMVAPGAATAQDGAWRPPLELSDIRQSKWSWFPDIAVKPDGSVAVIWCSFPKAVDYTGDPISIDALMYRELKDDRWSAINDLYSAQYSIAQRNILEGAYTVRNSMVAGRDGKLHIVFRRETDAAYMHAPWERSFSYNDWSSLVTLADSGAYYNALAIDSRANLHVFYTESVRDTAIRQRPGCPNCANLFYRYSNDGGETWSLSVNLSADLEGANRPQAAVDRFDRVHVVWDEGFDWYAGRGQPKYGAYRRSDDGGRTWSPPIRLGVLDDGSYQTTLAVDRDGNPIVVYRTAQWLYFQRSRDGGATWENPVEIPGVEARSATDPNLDRYSMEFDGAGNAHLLAVGFRTESKGSIPALLHLVWDGQRWSDPEVIYEGPLYPEWPRLAIAEGNRLHAVWFSRVVLYGDDVDIKQIWYSTKQLGGPAVAPPPLFTPTALPTATPAPTMPPAPTSPPRQALAARGLEAPLTWERSSIDMVGVALLPVAGLLALLVVGARLFRR
jgi:hypothetical protein